MIRTTLSASVLAAMLALSACSPAPDAAPDAATVVDAKPVAGVVTDMEAFNRFVDARPTAEDFRKAYPDVTLVMPGDISTREMRNDNSRYFAEVDESGRISGGRFM